MSVTGDNAPKSSGFLIDRGIKPFRLTGVGESPMSHSAISGTDISGIGFDNSDIGFGNSGSFGFDNNSFSPNSTSGFSLYGGDTGSFASGVAKNSNSGGGLPEAEGGWMDAASAIYSYGKLGLGVYNAMEQSKNNRFMKKYYKNQMALQRTDFANAARSTNEALSSRQKVRVSAKNIDASSGQGATEVANYMKKWGVDEKV